MPKNKKVIVFEATEELRDKFDEVVKYYGNSRAGYLNMMMRLEVEAFNKKK